MSDSETKLNEKLQAIVETVDIADTLTAPLMSSIKNLLTQTASLMNCDEASVLIRDGNQGDLRFLCAIGEVADKLLKMKVPAGKGIAGFVFSSGSPMAIADVGQEASFYDEVDKQTGFTTETILATPLRFEGEVIGVLEYINRIGGTPFAPFTPEEMDTAAIYADAFATLADAHEAASQIEKLFGKMLENISPPEDSNKIMEWLQTVRTNDEHREMLELALLVRDVAKLGANERKLAREILESVVRFSAGNAASETSFLSF